MTHPTDDTLDDAWNDIVQDSDAYSALDPTDTDLLRAMQSTASTVQPDPAFRDQLWAELSRRPIIATPAPTADPSLPAPHANRSGAPTMTPHPGLARRRWSPPIATIAAALVIALVGYGALSLSGANPSGISLNLNEIPNASAQGQGMGQRDNPVVGTWAWTGSFGMESSSSPDIFATLTFDADGTLIFTPTWNAVGHGTWTVDDDGRIDVDLSWLYTSDYFQESEQSGADQTSSTNIYPALVSFRIGFTLSSDGQRWEDQTVTYDLLVRDLEYTSGADEPTIYRINDFPPEMNDMEEGFDARRLDRVIDEAPGMTSAEAGLESSSAEDVPMSGSPRPMSSTGPSSPPAASHTDSTVAPNAVRLEGPTPTPAS